jgi:hypothetical protein
MRSICPGANATSPFGVKGSLLASSGHSPETTSTRREPISRPIAAGVFHRADAADLTFASVFPRALIANVKS